MTDWLTGPFLAFDTETTGTDVESDRIVTATTVLLEPGRDPDVTTWLLDPGVEIPQAASDVHGITTEHAQAHGRPAFECLWEMTVQLTKAWTDGIPVLAFNAAFDLTILDRNLRWYDLPPFEPALVLDPFVIDKQLDRYRKGKRTLTAACEHYGVRHGAAHDATADALAAARVMWALGQRYPTVADRTPSELHEAQQRWAAEQAASFRQYLIKQGTTTDLPTGEWPMRAYVESVAA